MSSKNRRSQRIPFNEKTNLRMEQFFSPVSKEETEKDSGNDAKEKPGIQAKGPKDSKIKLLIQVEGESRPIEYSHSKKDILYRALKCVGALKAIMISQSGKQVLVRTIQGIEAYLALHSPLHCLPEVTRLQIIVIRSQSGETEVNINWLLDYSPDFNTNCVKFYIHTVGKRAERIVQCRKLHKQGNKLCVYGFEGETIKEALCRDGRFLPSVENSVWKLVENQEYILESSQLVDDLEGRLFELEFEKRSSSRTAGAQNLETGERNTEASLDLYPGLKTESEKFKENFEKEFKGAKRKARFFNLHKTNFSKLVKDSTPVTVHKLLYNLSSSVGYLSWNNKGNMGCATCFVFHKQFIFTCWHVVRDIVGKGVDQTKWATLVSECTKVSFGYETVIQKEEKCFSLEPWFEVADESLDYAVLKLKIEKVQVPCGLYKGLHPASFDGLIYIIGHPEGKPKSTESCLVIPQAQREQECLARQAEVPFFHMFTQRSFQEISENNDVITYHSSFFFGASGSPVFNAEGSLLGMHAAGLSINFHKDTLIEFGPCMRSILSHMEKNFPKWYLEIAANPIQDEEMED
ncbi:serine protease FAM111A [Sorex fumeus]|uniref:serine protease FAM111A n=1 Tax=Sorex fumeus TaxID=62283 RepID=UPI0024ACA2D7|nr:serine protease FAM111A [Sorex fumeus]